MEHVTKSVLNIPYFMHQKKTSVENISWISIKIFLLDVTTSDS